MFETENIQSPSEREEEEMVHSPAQPTIYTERLNPISKTYKCLGGNKTLLTVSVLSSA
jgi:hypothetical protein